MKAREQICSRDKSELCIPAVSTQWPIADKSFYLVKAGLNFCNELKLYFFLEVACWNTNAAVRVKTTLYHYGNENNDNSILHVTKKVDIL